MDTIACLLNCSFKLLHVIAKNEVIILYRKYECHRNLILSTIVMTTMNLQEERSTDISLNSSFRKSAHVGSPRNPRTTLQRFQRTKHTRRRGVTATQPSTEHLVEDQGAGEVKNRRGGKATRGCRLNYETTMNETVG